MNPNKKDKKTKSSFSLTNLPIQNDPKKKKNQENKEFIFINKFTHTK